MIHTEKHPLNLVRIPLVNLSSHGGVRILVEIANALSRRGYRVELLIPPGKNSSIYQLDDEVRVKEIGVSIGSKFADYAIFLMILPFFLRRSLVVANFFVTYIPCRLGSLMWKCPFIYFVQDIESKYSGILGGVLNQVCNASYRSNHIVAANRYLAGALEKRGCRVFDTISIGPSEPFYAPLPETAARPYQLMYMPRHEKWKRLDRFEEICMCLDDVSRAAILCVGQDEEILAQLAQRGFSTRRPMGDSELVECYDSAQVFLLTSDREGFGLPPLEAMARGIPVVSFRCGGPDLYIQDGHNSFLVDDCELAASRIKQLLADCALYASLSQRATTCAQDYRLSEGLKLFVNCVSKLSIPSEAK